MRIPPPHMVRTENYHIAVSLYDDAQIVSVQYFCAGLWNASFHVCFFTMFWDGSIKKYVEITAHQRNWKNTTMLAEKC